MCFTKAPKPKDPIPPPQRKEAAVEADETRRRLAFRKGAASTIRTSPLGDPRYGSGVSKPIVTGV